MEYDVVVVGGGPSGALAAKYSAKGGAKTLIIEEHPEIGEPVQCAGLISKKALEECEIKPKGAICRSIRGAIIHSPSNTVEIDGKETKAYVVERKILDRLMVKEAIDSGADILLRCKFISMEDKGEKKILRVILDGKKERIKTRIIIGADGIKSRVAMFSGFGKVKKVLPGIQIEGICEIEDRDFVHIFLGRDLAPGFFGWVIPTYGKIARVGLCSDEKPYFYLKKLAKRVSCRGCSDLVMGGIPMGALKRTAGDGIMVVGDAAGQVKPTSGGGIYPGAVCAKIAGEVAAHAMEEDDVRYEKLREYERRWYDSIGKELERGMRIHEMFRKMKDEDFDRFLEIINDEEILDLIRKYGDMDRPSKLAIELIKKPRVFFGMLGLVRRILME
ncbi:MAG: NAD(P)/FAD-dependent oxidoreductase [Candidatus Syntropharchaeia archaeon]